MPLTISERLACLRARTPAQRLYLGLATILLLLLISLLCASALNTGTLGPALVLPLILALAVVLWPMLGFRRCLFLSSVVLLACVALRADMLSSPILSPLSSGYVMPTSEESVVEMTTAYAGRLKTVSLLLPTADLLAARSQCSSESGCELRTVCLLHPHDVLRVVRLDPVGDGTIDVLAQPLNCPVVRIDAASLPGFKLSNPLRSGAVHFLQLWFDFTARLLGLPN